MAYSRFISLEKSSRPSSHNFLDEGSVYRLDLQASSIGLHIFNGAKMLGII